MEFKTCFNIFKEGERVNEEVLVKEHKYSKMSIKLLMRKIKEYYAMYGMEAYQSLMSQALRDVGTKSYHTPNVMTIMAEYNSKKGDHEKALQYITRA